MPFLEDHWCPVARVGDVDDGPRTVTLFGRQFTLWRGADGGEHCLTQHHCPHRSAELGAGWLDGGELVCPYHGWRFDVAGTCTRIPQLDPGLPIPSRAGLSTWPVVERYGLVWTCVGDPVSDGPPAWPEADEGGWRVAVEFFEEWAVAAPRIIDNVLDQSHPAYVHRGTFGDTSRALVPRYDVEPTATGFRARIAAETKGVGVQMGVSADETLTFERLTEVELVTPLVTRVRLHNGSSGPDYCFFGPITPIDDHRSMYCRITALAGSEQEQPFEPFTAFGHRVKEEDRVLLETTRPDLPLDLTSEVHLRADRTTLEYRRHLARALDAHLAGSALR